MTMRQRASAFLLLLVIMLSGLLSYVFYRSVDEMLKDELQRRGDAIAESVAESSTLGVLLGDKVILIDVATRFLSEEDVAYIWILNRDVEPLYPPLSTLDAAAFDQVVQGDILEVQGKIAVIADMRVGGAQQKTMPVYHVAVPIWRQPTAAGAVFENGDGEKTSAGGSARELVGFVQVGLTLERIEEQARMVMFRAAFLVMGVAFFGTLAAAVMLNRWLEPLQVVTALARRIRLFGFQRAVGGTEHEVEYSIANTARSRQADEIGLLQDTFLEMVKEIGVHDRRLREQKQRLKQMVAQRTEQLARAKEEALAANRAKSRFLASMSHELRTPLNAVIGYTEMLQHGFARNPEKQAEYLEIIRSSGQHLLSVINDILDLSKLEEGGYSVHPERFSLQGCMEQAMAFVQPMVLEKKLLAALNCPDIEVVSDERMLKQVMINLLSNACKFTPTGGHVDVTVKDERGMVDIVVADNGEGMTQDEVQQALQAFVQIGAGETRSSEGTGLGLPIVDRFVKLMKGKLSIFSEKGEGTIVRIRLPKHIGGL